MAIRSADAAKALFAKAPADPSHSQSRVINTDKTKVIRLRFINRRKKDSYDRAAAIGLFNI